MLDMHWYERVTILTARSCEPYPMEQHINHGTCIFYSGVNKAEHIFSRAYSRNGADVRDAIHSNQIVLLQYIVDAVAQVERPCLVKLVETGQDVGNGFGAAVSQLRELLRASSAENDLRQVSLSIPTTLSQPPNSCYPFRLPLSVYLTTPADSVFAIVTRADSIRGPGSS
jgi:hypothetical protein